MEKCTFCLQRTREGDDAGLPRSLPDRCAQVRQRAGSESEVAEILKHKRVFVLKQDVGTLPRFYYYFDEDVLRSSPADRSRQRGR
jgi:Fe-S-cluster-containing dehydrogenase component